jgi:hypothetical protein
MLATVSCLPVCTAQVSELEAVLGALGWPSLNVLASSAHTLGYILGRTVVRYTKNGLIRGQKNLELPPVEGERRSSIHQSGLAVGTQLCGGVFA